MTGGIRDDWAELVGQPHPMGIELNVNISNVNRNDVEYQIRGIVDVPSRPHSDDERDYLARILFRAASIPEKGKRGWRLISWVSAMGGSGIRIFRCGKVRTLTEKDLDLRREIKVFKAPDVEELEEKDCIGPEKHNEWSEEYIKNRYCRFESRKDLNQRYQDIKVNTQVLKPSGKMGLTNEAFWYELLQHVIVEMLFRGEPPNEQNRDPRVKVVQPFFDGKLCRKAAAVFSARGTSNDMIVKYGKYEHMKRLYENGLVYLNVASNFDNLIHNPAIKDNERTIVFRGGYSPIANADQFYNRDTAPENVAELADNGQVQFSTIFQCPSLERHEYFDFEINMLTNYWMFCMAGVLDQRLFADFEADSCVIIRREPFIRRLFVMSQLLLPNTNIVFGHVNYVDPLGAFPVSKEVRVDGLMPIHMTKVFRYAYQREVRFVSVPRKFQEHLEPIPLKIGPISDIAEFIVL